MQKIEEKDCDYIIYHTRKGETFLFFPVDTKVTSKQATQVLCNVEIVDVSKGGILHKISKHVNRINR